MVIYIPGRMFYCLSCNKFWLPLYILGLIAFCINNVLFRVLFFKTAFFSSLEFIIEIWKLSSFLVIYRDFALTSQLKMFRIERHCFLDRTRRDGIYGLSILILVSTLGSKKVEKIVNFEALVMLSIANWKRYIKSLLC